MSGTVAGGLKASKTIKSKYGADWYKRIGAQGGRMGHTGGFYVNRELASRVGRKGGRISKRGTKSIEANNKRVVEKLNKERFMVLDDMDSPLIDIEKKKWYQGWFNGKSL